MCQWLWLAWYLCTKQSSENVDATSSVLIFLSSLCVTTLHRARLPARLDPIRVPLLHVHHSYSEQPLDRCSTGLWRRGRFPSQHQQHPGDGVRTRDANFDLVHQQYQDLHWYKLCILYVYAAFMLIKIVSQENFWFDVLLSQRKKRTKNLSCGCCVLFTLSAGTTEA